MRILGSGWASALARTLVTGRAELAAALYPELCWSCRERAAPDGYGCAEHSPLGCAFGAGEARCSGCAVRLPEGLRSGLCATCRRTARGYDHLVAFGSYASPLREWILALKHGGRRELAVPLGSLLVRALERSGAEVRGALLVPVPLHPLRAFERGYDQARLLAVEVGESLGLELVPALRRTRWTPPQGAPGARSRSSNVEAAFELVARRARRLAGRSLWLVDDVVTSGATVAACARSLRAARPAEIAVLALARVELEERAATLPAPSSPQVTPEP